MKTAIIRGGTPLIGEVAVSGSKNAALPIIFATAVTRGVSRIHGVPHIGDIAVALDILRTLGASVSFIGGELTVDCRALRYAPVPKELTCSIRASTYLIGSMLSVFGKCELSGFGGCGFSERPVDMHIESAIRFGARPCADGLVCDGLRGCDIHLRLPSVGATVNSLLMAVSAVGESRIFGYAREPHVYALVDFLRSAGAMIEEVDGALAVMPRALHGGEVRVIGDMIEAGTYLAAGLITDGRVTLSGCPVADMDAFLALLVRLGASVNISESTVSAEYSADPEPVDLVAEPYPGFPTDLQPIAAVLLATRAGGTLTDTVFPRRFGYLSALSTFGVNSAPTPHGARIFPSALRPATSHAPDLRGGAAATLLALSADGESRVTDFECVLRGYEYIDTKLRALGAGISID